MNIEVFKIDVPEWIAVKMDENISESKSQSKKIQKTSRKDGVFLRDYCIGFYNKNDELFCTLCLQDGKYPPNNLKQDKDLVKHLVSEHMPVNWKKYHMLCFPH